MNFDFTDIDPLPYDELTDEQEHLIRKKALTDCILSGSDRKDIFDLEKRFIHKEGLTIEEAKETMSKIKIALEELINSEPFLREKLEKNEKNKNYIRKLRRKN